MDETKYFIFVLIMIVYVCNNNQVIIIQTSNAFKFNIPQDRTTTRV